MNRCYKRSKCYNDKLGDFTNENDKKISVYGVYAYNGEYWVHAHYDWNGRNEKESPMVYFPKKHVYLDNTWDPKWGEWLYVFREPRSSITITHTVPKYEGGGVHRGVDFVADESKDLMADVDYPVYSVGHGRVAYSNEREVTIADKNPPSYGNQVLIELYRDDKKYFVRYAHLKYLPYVATGDMVTPYTKLGIVGTTGKSDGVHLHFEVRAGDDWDADFYDPLYYFADINFLLRTKVSGNKYIYQKYDKTTKELRYKYSDGSLVE